MLHKEIKYKQEIIKQLYYMGSLSTADLSKLVDKSLSLTTKIVNDLIEEGIIVEAGFAPSNGGRRALTYALKPQQKYIVSVAMDQHISKIAILDIANQEIVKTGKQNLSLDKNKESLQALNYFIQNFVLGCNIDKEDIIGIGIGMPGFIDTKDDHNMTFLGKGIAKYISAETNLATFIDNDSSSIALAEKYFGAAKETQNAVIVNVSWGVGLGMVLNGKIFRGENGFAGEFSHIPIFNNNLLCSCGKIGCLETETSLNYIIEKIKSEIEEGRPSALAETLFNNENIDEIFQEFIIAAQSGDFLTIENISKAAYKIGQGIAILIHILNPKKIILSGRGVMAGNIWIAPIQQAINEFCINNLVKDIEVQISDIAEDAELIGAATLVMENLKNTKYMYSKQKSINIDK